jgi:6-phosphogluconolactonase/glucosamine-6-phosphate isomerase/deaminase
MKLYKVAAAAEAAEFIAAALSAPLREGKKVLWLVPGGSAIALAAEVAKRLRDVPLNTLTITLTDERYGPVGHPDSNWLQLEQAGFMPLPGAQLLPVLTGTSMGETVAQFSSVLKEQLAVADYALGLFGIGADGHTAGILPHSPAVTSQDFAAGYDAISFQRITMTPPAIAKLDEAVVSAMGETKWPVIDELESTDKPIPDQPAQLLKQVPKLTIFNDHKGEAL